MPSSSKDLQDKFRDESGYHTDGEATRHLESRGFKLTKSWEWEKPEGLELTERDKDAIIYLIEEWDYGGLLSEGE